MRTKSKPIAETSRQSILVVDDEQMGLALVKRVLCDAGFNVVTAQSGFECLDTFRRRPNSFDLILLDLTMPFMDGEETFGRLREIRPDIPVVLCTGFIEHDKLERMLHAGLSGFLRKPLPPDEMVSHVRALLEGIKFVGAGKPPEIPAGI
jgi:CheY-like chemotaxis protein